MPKERNPQPKFTRVRPIFIREKISNLYGLVNERLQELEMSWGELADEMGISRQYLWDLTSKEVVREDRLKELCEAIGMDLGELTVPV